jgi:flagellar hook-associated protein 1 FlgK
MPSIFSIGLSALSAAQAAQATTAHNIANVGVDGYNRQVTVQATNGAVAYGYGSIGMGTQIVDVKRIHNELLAKQVLSSQTSASYFTEYYAKISQLDDIVADPDAGMSPALQSFFSNLQELATHPNAEASRQAVLSGGETLVERFHSLSKVMDQSYATINGQLVSGAVALNSYATQIAELNKAIIKAEGGSAHAPNDLLDQRDQLITELNKMVKVTTLKESNGSVSVYMGSGQPLVMGTDKATITTVSSSDDPTRSQLAYEFKDTAGPIVIPDKLFKGGTLGGILDYRTNTLDPARNQLGRVATALAMSFNEQHKLGTDQNGLQGRDFFTIPEPTVAGRVGNSATASLTATITDYTKLAASDYRVDYNGTDYTITRMSDNTKTQVTAPATFPVTIDGVEFAAPTMAAGDVFTVRPTASSAGQIQMAITNTKDIAAATPIVTSGQGIDNMNLVTTGNTGNGAVASTSINKSTFVPGSTQSYTFNAGNIQLTPPAAVTVTTHLGQTTTYPAGTAFPYSEGSTISSGGVSFLLSGTPQNGDTFAFSPVAANSGTGVISAGKVNEDYFTSPLPAGTKLDFQYDSAANTLVPSASVGAVVVSHKDGTTTNYAAGAPITYTEGDTFTTGGISFTLTGRPANGDKFSVGLNTDSAGDNRNITALANLQTKETIGKTSYQGAYSAMVGFIGNKTKEIEVLGSAEAARSASLYARQQSESGVNRDEELANMIKNQYAYQGAAKVIQAASDMFEAIFSIR